MHCYETFQIHFASTYISSSGRIFIFCQRKISSDTLWRKNSNSNSIKTNLFNFTESQPTFHLLDSFQVDFDNWSAPNALSFFLPGNPRNKCSLQPGHSLMDWIRLGSSGTDLTGVGSKAGHLSVSTLYLIDFGWELGDLAHIFKAPNASPLLTMRFACDNNVYCY